MAPPRSVDSSITCDMPRPLQAILSQCRDKVYSPKEGQPTAPGTEERHDEGTLAGRVSAPGSRACIMDCAFGACVRTKHNVNTHSIYEHAKAKGNLSHNHETDAEISRISGLSPRRVNNSSLHLHVHNTLLDTRWYDLGPRGRWPSMPIDGDWLPRRLLCSLASSRLF